jgi:5-(carboxyamino)imidazole ribonucleotide synthase
VTAVLPPATVGIVGGGQLGWLLAGAAGRLGYDVVVLDPDPKCTASRSATTLMTADFRDARALAELAARCDLLLLDNEHIPSAPLGEIAAHTPVFPAPAALARIQDRLAQRRMLAELDVPQPAFHAVGDDRELAAAAECGDLFPGILKSRWGGYDGRGQVEVATAANLAAAWDELRRRPAVLERWIDFEREISLILVRDRAGNMAFYPPLANRHSEGVLECTELPAPIPPEVTERGEQRVRRIAEALDYVGVFTVEFFQLPDGELLVNEIAPRVHNSGHVTLDACATSQFEQQVRAACGLPLGRCEVSHATVMYNLPGDLWHDGETPDFTGLLAIPDTRLYLYRKEPRPRRKMGHITTRREHRERLERALAELRRTPARAAAST